MIEYMQFVKASSLKFLICKSISPLTVSRCAYNLNTYVRVLNLSHDQLLVLRQTCTHLQMVVDDHETNKLDL